MPLMGKAVNQQFVHIWEDDDIENVSGYWGVYLDHTLYVDGESIFIKNKLTNYNIILNYTSVTV